VVFIFEAVLNTVFFIKLKLPHGKYTMDCVFTVEVLDPFFLPFFHTEKQT